MTGGEYTNTAIICNNLHDSMSNECFGSLTFYLLLAIMQTNYN